MLVDVTQDHINKGMRGFCRFCPISYALIDAGFVNVSVTEEWIDVYSNEYGILAITIPQQLKDIIQLYDNKGKMDPFKFEIVIETHEAKVA